MRRLGLRTGFKEAVVFTNISSNGITIRHFANAEQRTAYRQAGRTLKSATHLLPRHHIVGKKLENN
jgi:hypothetical protein